MKAHTHACPQGCDECNENDCRRRVAGRVPACDCRCHALCFARWHREQGEAATLDRETA